MFTVITKQTQIMNNAVYRYYWWFKTIISIVVIEMAYWMGRMAYSAYLYNGLGISFVITSILTIFMVVLAVMVTDRVWRYKITVHNNTITEYGWFGKASYTLESWYYQGGRCAPLFTNGFVALSRQVAFYQHFNITAYHSHPVASITQFRNYHRACMTVLLLGAPVWLYMTIQVIATPPYWLHMSIYLVVIIISLVVWYGHTQLDSIYFVRDVPWAGPTLLYFVMIWNVMHTIGLRHSISVSNHTPLLLYSACASILIVSFIVKIVPATSKQFTTNKCYRYSIIALVWTTAFNTLFFINCVPSFQVATKVRTVIDAKEKLETIVPFWIITTAIKDHNDKANLYVPPDTYDHLQVGDTIQVTIHKGILGSSWHKTSYFHSDTLLLK